jgi:hypothetical protein
MPGIRILRDWNIKYCARFKAFYYCSKEFQVKYWIDEHKVDRKGIGLKDIFMIWGKPKNRSKLWYCTTTVLSSLGSIDCLCNEDSFVFGYHSPLAG